MQDGNLPPTKHLGKTFFATAMAKKPPNFTSSNPLDANSTHLILLFKKMRVSVGKVSLPLLVGAHLKFKEASLFLECPLPTRVGDFPVLKEKTVRRCAQAVTTQLPTSHKFNRASAPVFPNTKKI